MCPAFLVPETRFHLSDDISFFPWRPATEAESATVPPDLVQQIGSRLEEVVNGPRPPPPVSLVPGEHSAAVAAAAARRPAASGAVAAIHDDLSAWLASINLAEAEPVLRALGVEDAHDVKSSFQRGFITHEDLVNGGMAPVRADRLERKARLVRCLAEGGRCRPSHGPGRRLHVDPRPSVRFCRCREEADRVRSCARGGSSMCLRRLRTDVAGRGRRVTLFC